MSKRGYSIVGPSESGTTQTLIGVTGSTSVRARCYEWEVGSNTSPADQSWQPSLGRYTAAGTSSSYTPYPNDPQEVAAACTGGITHSAEPTYPGSNPIYNQQLPINQRASWKWQAYPDFEIVAAASSNNGLGLRGVGATASIVFSGTLFFFE